MRDLDLIAAHDQVERTLRRQPHAQDIRLDIDSCPEGHHGPRLHFLAQRSLTVPPGRGAGRDSREASARTASVSATDAGEGGGPGLPASHIRGLADTGAAITAKREYPVAAGGKDPASGLAMLVITTRDSTAAPRKDPEMISAYCGMPAA